MSLILVSMAWLDATWGDVSLGTVVRRENGEVGEVGRVERDGPMLRVWVNIEGQWRPLSVWPRNHVDIAVAAH